MSLSYSLFVIPDDVFNYLFSLLHHDRISLNVFAYANKTTYQLVSKYSIKNKISRRFKIENAALYGYLDVIIWALRNRYKFNKKVYSNAAKNGYLDLIKYFRNLDCTDWDVDTVLNAAAYDHLDILKYAIENGCNYSTKIYPNAACSSMCNMHSYAALYGHLDILIWCKQFDPELFDSKQMHIINNAANGGHLHVLQWLKNEGYIWNSQTFCNAARGGHLHILKMLKDDNCPYDSWTFAFAAERGDIKILEWLKEINCPMPENILRYASQAGRLDALKWLIENNSPKDENASICEAAYGGHLEVIKFMLNNKYVKMDRLDGNQLANLGLCAIKGGNRNVIDYVYKIGAIFPSESYCYAIQHNNFELVKMLRNQNIPWYITTYSFAIEYSNLEIMNWLRDNGCPWCPFALQCAINIGDLDKLSWIIHNGFDTTCIFNYAIQNSDIDTLKWVKKAGYTYDEHSCTRAAKFGHYAVLKWLRKKGAPWDQTTSKASCKSGNLDCLIFLIDNKCPYDIRDCYEEAKIYHNYNIMKWIKENYK